MSGNSFGQIFRITTFGESHGPGLGVVIDGCPPGVPLATDFIQLELDRRRPGQSEVTTPRKEADLVEILSGVFEGHTTGTPIAMLIRNLDADPSAYEHLRRVFRPGHADYTYYMKYGIRDHRGGGRSSGRETAARVAAGAVAKQILYSHKIFVVAGTIQVGGIRAMVFDPFVVEENALRCPDPAYAELMLAEVNQARERGDSIGGVVEVRARGVPAGLGEPVFGKLDADLAYALMGIGAVKAVEIGDGWAVASRLGTENQDPFIQDHGKIRSEMNRAGGILGGISTGEEIICRIAVKPTASIAAEQRTVDLEGRATTIQIKGRHDPCICPRIVPVAEAMTALVLVDHLLRQRAIEPKCGCD
jgi:chorismate synthase